VKDLAEIEQYLTEKEVELRSDNYGKDKEQSVKLLKRHKTTELELDSYTGLMREMDSQLDKIELQFARDKNSSVNKLLQKVLQLASERRIKLINNLQLNEFSDEVEEFLSSMEVFKTAFKSEDYGVDYEHLLLVLSRFEDVKGKYEACNGQYGNILEHGGKIVAAKTDDDDATTDNYVQGNIQTVK
jgi:spectrin beta